MKQSQIIYNMQTFTSTPQEQKVNFPNLKKASLTYVGLGTGTTAETLANAIAALSAVYVKVGGEQITNIRGDDLFALNYVERIQRRLGEKPQYLLSTTVDNTNAFLKLGVPLEITTDKDVYIQPVFGTTPANTDTGTITIMAEYGDTAYKEPPFRLTYISQNTATSFVQYDFNNAGHKLYGILIFSTTVTLTGTAGEASAKETKLYVNTKEKIYHDWFSADSPESYVENAVVQAILTKYRYIDLWDEPIPADQLKIAFKSLAATDAVRVIGIFR